MCSTSNTAHHTYMCSTSNAAHLTNMCSTSDAALQNAALQNGDPQTAITTPNHACTFSHNTPIPNALVHCDTEYKPTAHDDDTSSPDASGQVHCDTDDKPTAHDDAILNAKVVHCNTGDKPTALNGGAILDAPVVHEVHCNIDDKPTAHDDAILLDAPEVHCDTDDKLTACDDAISDATVVLEVHCDIDDKPTAHDDDAILDATVVHCNIDDKPAALDEDAIPDALSDDEENLDAVEDDIVDELQNAFDGSRPISYLCELTGHSPARVKAAAERLQHEEIVRILNLGPPYHDTFLQLTNFDTE